MFRRISAFIEKEFIQSIRDLRTLMIIIFIPVSMLILYAYAINYDIRNVDLGVLNFDSGRSSKKLLEQFENSGYFTIHHFYNEDLLSRSLKQNKIKIALVIPANFSKELTRKGKPEISVVIDGSDSNTARIATNYFFSIYEVFIKAEMGISKVELINYKTRILYNTDMRSLNFVIPGLIAVLLMVVGVQLTAPAIVREKEEGTLETLYTTPISIATIIIGKSIPFLIMGLFDGILVFLVAKYWFHIPFEGNFFIFLLITSIYLFTCISMGIFISTLSDSQLGVMVISFLSTLLPSIILSGFIFPIKNMPVAMQYITYLIPSRHYIVILRDIFLKGNHIFYYSNEILMLIIFAGVMLMLSLFRIRKRSD
ncbi:MAG: ABC transporter permease [bacterium]|nr:ABC transporter permease [bacterium]